MGRWSLLGLWGEPSAVHMAIMDRTDRGNRRRQPGLPRSQSILRSASTTRRRFDWSAPSTICSDCRRKACPIPAPGSITTSWGMRFPLGDRIDAPSKAAPYRFLPAEGDGLHQIAVGPVHAGIIEPGHFRFTASGETVVRLEQRLGYTHKGIEGLMTGASLERAVQLAGRVSGDSTVAYAYAFSRAAEAALGAGGARSRGVAARSARRTRAARQPSRRHRRDLQRCLLHPDARSLQRAARERAARIQCRIRPSIDAGHHRARRRDPRPRRATGRTSSGRRWTTSACAFLLWSSYTTTPHRCRIAPSIPACSSPHWPDSMPLEATSAARPAAPSTRAAPLPIRRMTACASRYRF